MLAVFGTTQQELLKEICKSKAGLTVDELADRIGVTRTAINQHIRVLEQDGFVIKGDLQTTGGRPGRSFILSQRGTDLFPKQYSWFSGIMLETIKSKSGSKGLSTFMKDTARLIGKGLESQVAGKSHKARLQESIQILNELSYDARLVAVKDKEAVIEATNCVYHSLAKAHPEVCEFDIEILSRLADSKVLHQECMVRGGNVCRFQLTAK